VTVLCRVLGVAVCEWIERWYNPHRRKLSIGDLCPIDDEARLTLAGAAAWIITTTCPAKRGKLSTEKGVLIERQGSGSRRVASGNFDPQVFTIPQTSTGSTADRYPLRPYLWCRTAPIGPRALTVRQWWM
jgi:hypothetical protein